MILKITHLFGGQLADRILAILISTHRSLNLRAWGHFCYPKVLAKDLIEMCRPVPTWRIEAAWIWRLAIHPRVRLFL